MKSTRRGSFSVHRSEKNPRFQRQLDKRPLSPGTSREASGVPCLNPRRGQEKSHVRNWRSKRYLAPLMRPHKLPRHPGLPGEEHRGFPAPLPLSPFYPPDLDRRVDSPALSGRGSRPSRRGLVGASTLRRTPISRSPLSKNPMPGHLSELHPVNEVNTKGQ